MIRHPVLAARYFNRPLALLPAHAALVLQALQAQPAAQFDQFSDRDVITPYDVVAGVAILPIRGCLVHDAAWWGWDEVSYGRICEMFRCAVDDTNVKAIALLMDSPGGLVAGCDYCAETIYAGRGTKPIWAILDECAYSAGYWLAAAADRITVPRTGGTGSIGVVGMHLDVTKALDQMGLTITTFQFGERKTDSYPTTPMSTAAAASFQADIDITGEMFVDAVARFRGLTAETIRGTEAATYLGAAGVALGLADAVMAPDDALRALIAQIA